MNTRPICWRQSAFVLFLLHMTHCGPPGHLGESATLSGQLADWTEGPGSTLDAYLSDGSFIATADIDAQGRFRIALPTIPKDDGWFGQVTSATWLSSASACTGSIEASADTYVPITISFVTAQDHTPTGSVSYRNQPTAGVPLVEAEFFYISTEFRQVGEVDCDFGDRAYHTSYDMNFLPGLNRVVWTSALFNPNFRLNAHSGAVPGDVGWVVMR